MIEMKSCGRKYWGSMLDKLKVSHLVIGMISQMEDGTLLEYQPDVSGGRHLGVEEMEANLEFGQSQRLLEHHQAS
jgi:hypothetical protein